MRIIYTWTELAWWEETIPRSVQQWYDENRRIEVSKIYVALISGIKKSEDVEGWMDPW